MKEVRREIPAFETTSLINKFKSLWLSGIEAKLEFETRAGQAWGSLHVHLGEHPQQAQQPPHHRYHCKNETPCRRRRRERREAARLESNINDRVAEKAAKSTDTEAEVAAKSTEKVAVEKDNDVAGTEEVTEENEIEEVVAGKDTAKQLFLPVEVDDEVCDDEMYYEVVDPDIAFTCLQCNLGYFPAKYKEGDTVKKWGICRWHLGVSKCGKCGKTFVGMDRIRAHRQICHQEEIT